MVSMLQPIIAALILAALCAAALALGLGLMMRRRLHHAMSQKDA